MNKKQADRRPDERPPEQSAARYDPSKPHPGRLPEDPQEDREFHKPAGRPVDKPLPTPEARRRGKDGLEGERSDRESGRPVQLEEDEEGREAEPTKR
jgi:hypothetical protein